MGRVEEVKGDVGFQPLLPHRTDKMLHIPGKLFCYPSLLVCLAPGSSTITELGPLDLHPIDPNIPSTWNREEGRSTSEFFSTLCAHAARWAFNHHHHLLGVKAVPYHETTTDLKIPKKINFSEGTQIWKHLWESSHILKPLSKIGKVEEISRILSLIPRWHRSLWRRSDLKPRFRAFPYLDSSIRNFKKYWVVY